MGTDVRANRGDGPPPERAHGKTDPDAPENARPEPKYDVRGTAAALGVSVQTVYLLCAKRRLRHVRVGVGRGTIRVPSSAIREYLDGATVRPDGPAAPAPVGTKRVSPRYLRPPA